MERKDVKIGMRVRCTQEGYLNGWVGTVITQSGYCYDFFGIDFHGFIYGNDLDGRLQKSSGKYLGCKCFEPVED